MIDLFVQNKLLDNFFIFFFFSFLLHVFVIFNWKFLLKKFFLYRQYNSVQKIHHGDVSRLGGFISILSIVFFFFYSRGSSDLLYLKAILISSIPMLIISIKEDLMFDTKASVRLSMMFVSCFLFFYFYSPIFPNIEFPVIGKLLETYPILAYIFFSFCLVVVINGNNLIDGANGLMPASIITQCITLLFLTYKYSGNINNIYLILIILCMVIFLIFNYPLGKIFLGDTGAYFFGFMVGTQTIIIFSQYQQIPTWSAILILIYPSFELLFSFIRKFQNGINPMHPDKDHLHLKLFFILERATGKALLSNNLVTLIMSLIWFSPYILFVNFHESINLTIIGFAIYIVFYISSYNFLSRIIK